MNSKAEQWHAADAATHTSRVGAADASSLGLRGGEQRGTTVRPGRRETSVLSLFLSCRERILLLEQARQEAFATRVDTRCDCASGELPMTKAKQTSGKVSYGWWVVLAAGVCQAMHYGPIIVPTFGVFLKPLSQEFGWSWAQISLAFSLSVLGVTLTVPFIGRLVDHFGARRVILPAVLLFGLSVLSLSFLSAHLWHFYVIYLLMGVAAS